MSQIASRRRAEPQITFSSSVFSAKGRQQAALFGLCVLLTFSVLAFGGVETWATSVIELGSCILFALVIIPLVISGSIRDEKNPMLVPLAILGAVIAFQVLFHQTSYWYATYCAFLKFVAYAALFVVAARLFKINSARVQFAYFASVFGGVVALFALLQDFSSHGTLYWLHVPESPSHIFGPYVNRNHYAGLMEMLAPFPFVLAFRSHAGKRDLLLFGGALIVISIFLSGSRGGMLAFVFETVFVLCVTRPRPSNRQLLFALAFGGCIGLLLFWLGSSELVSRLTLGDVKTESTFGRLAICRDSFRMVPHHWVTGWGAGTFPEVFPRFRSFSSDLLVNAVHNDYLQTLVETGIVGLLAMLSFFGMPYRRALRVVRTPIGDDRMIRLAALTGCTGLLIHGLWDFNLQVPANAAWLFVLIALATMIGRERDRVTHFRTVPVSGRRKRA